MSQLRPEQLTAHLKQQLLPVYFVHGDEPLQITECVDQIRATARQQGYTDRQVFSVEPGFDWDSLRAAADTLSLFSEQRILELRMPNGKPGDKGSRALRAYCEQLPVDTLLLIVSGKLEPAARRSKWVQSLESAGASITVWPVDVDHLPAWIDRRMRARGLQPDQESLQVLVDRVEGNLLACSQEIEKLFLLNGPGPVDATTVSDSVARSARYDVFGLVDAALLGQAARSQHILSGLRAEGVDPTVVLWALSRELRTLAPLATDLKKSGSMGRVLTAGRVWEKRKTAVAAGLQRISPNKIQSMLRRCVQLDRVIKGRAAGSTWDELLQLIMQIAGVRLFENVSRNLVQVTE
jgi:DNA polymerase-3 subunit delta